MPKIYALYNPITNLPFYVGATRGPLSYRLSGHVSSNPNRKKSNCISVIRRKYITGIIQNGSYPKIKLLETCPERIVNDRERHYYNLYKRKGINLLQHPSFFVSGGSTDLTRVLYEFVIRMPPELGEEIKMIAKNNRRKINDELLIAVERHAAKNKLKWEHIAYMH